VICLKTLKVFLVMTVIGAVTITIFALGIYFNQDWLMKLGLFIVIFEVVAFYAFSMPETWPQYLPQAFDAMRKD